MVRSVRSNRLPVPVFPPEAERDLRSFHVVLTLTFPVRCLSCTKRRGGAVSFKKSFTANQHNQSLNDKKLATTEAQMHGIQS